jgi:hypothetical protein
MRGVYRPAAIVQAWFDLLPARHVGTTRALLDAVQAAAPDLTVQVKWGNLVCQLGGASVLAIAPSRKHVHLQVFDGMALQRRFPMLRGDGPGLRHLLYRHGEAIDDGLVHALVIAAHDLTLARRPPHPPREAA